MQKANGCTSRLAPQLAQGQTGSATALGNVSALPLLAPHTKPPPSATHCQAGARHSLHPSTSAEVELVLVPWHWLEAARAVSSAGSSSKQGLASASQPCASSTSSSLHTASHWTATRLEAPSACKKSATPTGEVDMKPPF